MVETAISNTVRLRKKIKLLREKRENGWAALIWSAKILSKNGFVSRGTPIHEGVCSYLISVADRIREGFETIEDEVIIANNVLEQTRGQEVHLASNQVASSIIIRLIAFAHPEIFEGYLTAFAENFRPIGSDRYASYVIGKVIDVCFLRAAYYKKQDENDEGEPANKKRREDPEEFEKTYNVTQEFKNSHREKCSNFIEKLGNFVANNLESFLWDPCANHIMQKSIICLAGIREVYGDFSRIEDVADHMEVVSVPGAWIEIINQYVERLQTWPQFADLAYKSFSSLVLAYLLVALRTCNKTAFKQLATKILVESFIQADEDKNKETTLFVMDGNDNEEQKKNAEDEEFSKTNVAWMKVFEKTCSMRVLAVMLSTAENDVFSQVYSTLFMGRVSKLACNVQTCFNVQKMIEHIKQPTYFKSVFEELHPSMKTLLTDGYSGVVEALAKTCLRLSTKQGAFVSAILSALHISDSKEKFKSLIICILKLKPYEVAIKDKTQFIHLHGALILQHMLQFNKANKLAQYILKIPAKDLALIFSTLNGSYVANMFIQSKTITDRSREKLLRHLKGEYLSMARNQYGSRVVKKLLEIANQARKTKIEKELLKKTNFLKTTSYGKMMCKLLEIDTYQSSSTPRKAAISKTKRNGSQKRAVTSKSIRNGIKVESVKTKLKKFNIQTEVATTKSKKSETQKKAAKSKAGNAKSLLTDIAK